MTKGELYKQIKKEVRQQLKQKGIKVNNKEIEELTQRTLEQLKGQ